MTAVGYIVPGEEWYNRAESKKLQKNNYKTTDEFKNEVLYEYWFMENVEAITIAMLITWQ